MSRPKEYIGTGEELEPLLKQVPKQSFRLIPLSATEEADMAESEEKPTRTPDEKGLAIMRAIAERQKGRRYTDPSDTPRLLREARGGAMYGYDPTE